MNSQCNKGRQFPCCEANGNNAWYLNGNNGNLNYNNNKYNAYRVRRVLDSERYDNSSLDSYIVPLVAIYNCYDRTCRHKRTKASFLYFMNDAPTELIDLCHAINNMEYMPQDCILFMVHVPKLREVIAAYFLDRVAQTYLVDKLIPYLEKYMHPDSYSCRVGKGGLRAAMKLRDYIFMESKGYTQDCWVYSFDFASFFMSIDTMLLVPMLTDFIDANLPPSQEREILKYLTRVIYQCYPQEHCRRMGDLLDSDDLPKSKSMLHKTNNVGVPIGNRTSQTAGNYITTPVLWMLTDMGIKFVQYTDDNTGVVRDEQTILKLMPLLRQFCHEKLHLKIHPNKFYLQHYSKGIRCGAYKLRFDHVLPNDRIAHNFRWKIEVASRKADKFHNYVYKTKEHIVSVVNSYCGLLKYCHSYRLRKEVLDGMKESRWSVVLDFAEDYSKVTIKPSYTLTSYYVIRNKKVKRALLAEWRAAA